MRTCLTCILFLFVFTGCIRDYGDPRKPPLPEESEEKITTFRITFRDSASGAVQSYFLRDDDGDINNGGTYYGPDFTTQTDSVINLKSHSTYYTEILLLNETHVPADTVSAQVNDESAEHMLFYSAATNSVVRSDPYTVRFAEGNIQVVYDDKDKNGLPLGLKTKWSAADPVVFRGMKIVLKHQPEGKNGSYDVGTTDLEVKFSCKVF